MTLVPPLLQKRCTDEYAPLPRSDADRRALCDLEERAPNAARAVGLPERVYALDRRGTAATLRAVDAAHGGGFFAVPAEAEKDLAAADEAFRGNVPVVDVQTHLVDPGRWGGEASQALSWFLQVADPERWPQVDPGTIDGAAWASLVFGASETAIALLTSTPGTPEHNVLSNPQIAAARDVVDRYAGSGRVLTHTIVHPNFGPEELDQMVVWHDELRPAGWKVYTLWGPATKASPDGGWFLDDEEVGFPFLERVRALGPRVIATHKGISGPIPEAAVPAGSPRDIGPAARAFPDIAFVVYHSGYEPDPSGHEGPYAAEGEPLGTDRLVRSLNDAGVHPGSNVYAELGTTWFLMLRRPQEAAHVLGKLLLAVGPDNIVWGTDSIWYGSPQPLIDAFRAFQIPPSFQERYGYPALTPDIKDRIMSRNARAVYGISDDQVARAAAQSPDWATNAAPEILKAVDAARNL
jgi:predicted TIM-barrel fold metal-dependent hydrolase